jgi:hypothetical protein
MSQKANPAKQHSRARRTQSTKRSHSKVLCSMSSSSGTNCLVPVHVRCHQELR